MNSVCLHICVWILACLWTLTHAYDRKWSIHACIHSWMPGWMQPFCTHISTYVLTYVTPYAHIAYLCIHAMARQTYMRTLGDRTYTYACMFCTQLCVKLSLAIYIYVHIIYIHIHTTLHEHVNRS